MYFFIQKTIKMNFRKKVCINIYEFVDLILERKSYKFKTTIFHINYHNIEARI